MELTGLNSEFSFSVNTNVKEFRLPYCVLIDGGTIVVFILFQRRKNLDCLVSNFNHTHTHSPTTYISDFFIEVKFCVATLF